MSDPADLHENLSIFRHAVNWKTYWSKAIAPFVGERVLEAGAGVGANTALLMEADSKRFWVCMEPDTQMVRELKHSTHDVRIVSSTVDAISEQAAFDSILYIDVLEHIEDDGGEVYRASQLLAPNGRLIVLSPAYNFLYSEYDEAIGHYRRYTRQTLSRLKPEDMRLVMLKHLDSVGLLLSLGNRLLLREKQPNRNQILFWDRVIIPLSRMVDPLIRYRAGRSIIAIWEREA